MPKFVISRNSDPFRVQNAPETVAGTANYNGKQNGLSRGPDGIPWQHSKWNATRRSEQNGADLGRHRLRTNSFAGKHGECDMPRVQVFNFMREHTYDSSIST